MPGRRVPGHVRGSPLQVQDGGGAAGGASGVAVSVAQGVRGWLLVGVLQGAGPSHAWALTRPVGNGDCGSLNSSHSRVMPFYAVDRAKEPHLVKKVPFDELQVKANKSAVTLTVLFV